jgi:Ca2+:H+ antiporter
LIAALLENRLNLLMVAAPVSWVLRAWFPGSLWIFVTAAIALVPLAGLIGLGTEELAARSGPTVGGFLNATFGNAAELIIAIVALGNGHVAMVKASITGSIVGNLLLVLGLSFFAGGIGRAGQKFDRTAAGNMTAMLFLAVVALVMPAVFDLALYGSLAPQPSAINRLSIGAAVVLIVAYAGSLIYAYTSRQDLLGPTSDVRHHATLSSAQAIGLLAVGTILTTIQAELLVHTLEPAMRDLGLTELFVGAIVIAVIGNAAEHYSAVIAARRNQMTLAVEIAIGSSAQIALLIAPSVVLYSFLIGHPMSLLFNAFEITAITLSVLAMVIVSVDGESNWVEGLQLLSVYVIVAIAFYLVPA